jgi:aldehyde dehydrogenase (NAD+)
MSYIESGKREGATLLLGGDRIGNEGFFIQPTVFTDIKPEMKIVKEEIFGPVVAITKFKDEEGSTFCFCFHFFCWPEYIEVIKLANDTTYGLSASIFTENVTRAIRVSRALEAGTIWVCSTFLSQPYVLLNGSLRSTMLEA